MICKNKKEGEQSGHCEREVIQVLLQWCRHGPRPAPVFDVAGAAVAAMSLLLGSSFFAPAVTRAEATCATNLTCPGQTDVAEHRFSMGPDLSAWNLLSPKPTDAVLPIPQVEVPRVLQESVTGMEFVLIPGACYRADGWGEPPRTICLDAHYIGAYEVTFDQYDTFARATDRKLPDDEGWGRGRRPVINVSLYEALNFAKWLSRKTGVHHRLPTEVEWEHAARAGSTSTYPWDNELGENRANCDGCGSRWDGERTAPVGSFSPNAWGVYDMIGNVGEWTCSMRDPDPAHSFEQCDSIFETRRRAIRNGGWDDDADRVATAFRDWNVAMRRVDDVGFRLVRECSECKAGFPQSPQELMIDTARDNGGM